MSVPPDFEIEDRERRGFVVGYPEDANIRELCEAAPDKNRVRERRVVVPGEDHHRQLDSGEQPERAVENGMAQLVVFKSVAGQKNDIGPHRPCGCQHRAQARRPVAISRAGNPILVDMQVRAVDEDDFGAHRQAIASASAGRNVGSGALPAWRCCGW